MSDSNDTKTTTTPPAGSTMEIAAPFGKYRVASESRLRELGLWDDDVLVISVGPSRKKSILKANGDD